MTVSNRLGITEIGASQVDRSVTINEAIAKLEAGACLFGAVSVLDNAPPGSPAEGDIYVVGTAGSGAFTGHNEAIAVYYNAAWLFLPPLAGMQAYAADEDAFYYYDVGGTWVLVSSSGGVGDVTGPGSSVSGNIATFSGTSGKVVQDSGVAISTDGTFAANSDANLATEKATRTYIDGLAINLGKRGRVRVASTANITISTALNNGDSLDGVTLATGDLVLVKDQSAPAENGIYVVGVSPARSSEFDTYDEHPGTLIAVEEGTAGADTLWLCTSNAGGTLNTAAIAFSQLVVGSVSDGDKGDITVSSTGTVWTIDNDVVTNAKAANMATATIKGRTTAGTGDPEDLTATQATAILNAMVGDSGSGGTKGLAPAPASGDAAAQKYLKADGTWAVPSGSGASTSTDMIAGAGLTGGGTLAANRTFAVGAGTGITVNTDDVQIATAYQAIGKHTVWVPATAMTARTTNGAASGTAEMSTNKNMVSTLDFDTSTQEFAQFDIAMPKGWDNGTVTFVAYWSHAATTTNFGVAWGLDAVAVSDDDTLDVAFGTAGVVTDTGGTTNDLYVSSESSAITIAGTPATSDLVQFRIHRDPANGSDTMAIDARLHGCKLLFTLSAANDA
ncbi:DUF2793 domain-containing protein [Mesorhizobium neociceri]|uniref:DUF2793 domain-containing protein n=1 Tax=Mesorhizobium neociceri TaxID=1307853 RepID=A0A838B7W2_9HYPH|nr:DUF2793 domain-containing protein [Mesorhizobium neociceri]MBA1141764.1 DUF2793 domain-containing protein [Mesorhizobium neociceri]